MEFQAGFPTRSAFVMLCYVLFKGPRPAPAENPSTVYGRSRSLSSRSSRHRAAPRTAPPADSGSVAPPGTMLKRSGASIHEVIAENSPAAATMASEAIVAAAVLFVSWIFIWLGATVRESDFLALESNSVPGGTSPSSILIILLRQLASAQEELPRWRHRASAGARHKEAPADEPFSLAS